MGIYEDIVGPPKVYRYNGTHGIKLGVADRFDTVLW